MTRLTVIRSFWPACMIFAVGALAACSGLDDKFGLDEPADENPPAATAPERVAEQPIAAAEGGAITTPAGEAAIDIPANALGGDTTITIDVLPAVEDTASAIYDFGPDGTKFATPARIALEFTGAVPEGKRAILAWQDGTNWIEVPGSSLSNGKVSGDVDHFTHFAVVFRDGEAVVISGCAQVADAFSPCGGDVMGDWVMSDLCFADMVIDGGSMAEACPEMQMDVQMDWDGTVTFDGTNMIRRIEVARSTMQMNIPRSCLPPGATCDMLSESMDDGGCQSVGESCDCSQSGVDEVAEVEEDTYTVDGPTLVIESPDGDIVRAPYCVDGNQMTLKAEPEDPDEPSFYFVLTRP